MRRLAPLLLFAVIMLLVVLLGRRELPRPTPPAVPPQAGPGAEARADAAEAGAVATESTATAPQDGTGTLVGSVTDGTGTLLAGGRLYLSDRGVVPAPTGTFRVEGLPPGPLAVQAAAPGHPPVDVTADIVRGEEVRLDIVLVPGGVPLAGRVVDGFGEPIPGAFVSITPRSPGRAALRHRVQVGPDGTFRTEGLLPGPYSLSASAPFTAGAWVPELKAGRTDIVLTLHPAGELAVRVEGRESVDGVKFLLRTADGELAGWWDWSEDESFLAKELIPGSYLVFARDGDGNTASARVVVEAGVRTALRVELAPGETLTGRVIRRADGAPIAGAVVAAAENDAPAILGNLLDPDEEVARLNGVVTTRTDTEGRYVLAGLHSGSWLVAAHAPAFEPAVREGVEVPGDGPQFVLTRGGSVAVEVRDDEGRPVPEAMVSISVDGTGEVQRDGETDAAGRCVLEGLPAGERYLWVQVGFTDWLAGRTLTVVAGEREEVVVRQPREEAWLVGRITRGGSPLPDRRVSVVQEEAATGNEFHLCARTDADGRFRIGHLAVGEGALRSGGAISFGPIRCRLKLRPGENLLDLDLSGRTLMLRVVDEETGRAIPARAGTEGSWGSADADGLIRLLDLPAEEIEVAVVCDAYGPARITLTPSRDPEEVRVGLTPAVRFTLKVVDDLGRAVAGAEVSVLDAKGWDLGGHAEEWFTSHPMAGTRVLDLAPGRYTLRVEAPGFRPNEEALPVPVPDGLWTVVLFRE